jgi:hypothetical protein
VRLGAEWHYKPAGQSCNPTQSHRKDTASPAFSGTPSVPRDPYPLGTSAARGRQIDGGCKTKPPQMTSRATFASLRLALYHNQNELVVHWSAKKLR